MLLRTLLPCLLPLTLLGCEEWPRFANPPEDTSLPGDVDARALASEGFDWATAQWYCKEVPDTLEELDAESHIWEPKERYGNHIFSRLRGSGVTSDGPFIEDNPCAEPWNKGLNGRRYLNDVDLYQVKVSVGATLCASAFVPDRPSEYNLDVRVFRADDACHLPTGTAIVDASTDPPTPLGLGSDDWVEWSLITDTEYYTLMVAAFKGEIGDDEYVNYHLGLSVVPASPDGTPGICPNLSNEKILALSSVTCDDEPEEDEDPEDQPEDIP